MAFPHHNSLKKSYHAILQCNVVEIRCSQQHTCFLGIAQGSILSTYFCNIFYGDMENTHLKDLMISDDCVLMRWTDDFLLITSSKDYAHTFLRKLITGFREYGCKINVKKSKTNLPADCCDELKVIERVNGSWFPWCNLLINVNTLQVRLSYKRYIGNTSMVITESLCHYGKINIPGSYSPLLLTVIFLHELELCIRPPGLIPNTTN